MVESGNFPARNPVNRAVTRRRCGRSSADTFERVPVVGAEMGGHGEARLAGPDTAISGARGIETVAQGFARLEFFQLSRLLFAPPRCFRFQAADRAAGVGERKKSPRFARKNRPVECARSDRTRALAVASVN